MSDEAADALRDRYNREALAYRDLWAPILRKAGRRLVAELAGGRVERVLDVGSGVGALLPDIVETYPGATVLAVDRSPGMLRLAGHGSQRAVMDARALGVRSGGFDRAVLAFMLFHLDQPEAALREVRRTLRPGGRVGTLTWAADLDSEALRLWTSCLDEHGAPPVDPATQARHDQVDTPEKMTALLRDAGFTSVRAREDELVHEFDVEHLVALRTSMGSSLPRFEGLNSASRDACVTAARMRMKELGPEGFIARARIVMATGGVED
jgi:SAM-dependent methyltransferase